MADDIGADDFACFSFDNEYGSEAASVVIKETGKRGRDTDDYKEDADSEQQTKKKRKKQKTNKSSKFIKERDESQAIRTAPISDQSIYLQGTCCSTIKGKQN